MNDDKVLEALQVIKEYCKEQENVCENCKFYSESYESCIFYNVEPAVWEINVNKEYKFIL